MIIGIEDDSGNKQSLKLLSEESVS